MPVHSIVIVNMLSGKILLSRCYETQPSSSSSSSSASSSYELRLSKELEPYQHRLRNSNKRYTLRLPSSSSSSSSSSDIYVVFQGIQDLVLIVSGTDDIDEIILSSILDSLVLLLTTLLDHKLVESSLSNTDTYTKLLVCLDEMFPQGLIETLDIERVQQLIKLK